MSTPAPEIPRVPAGRSVAAGSMPGEDVIEAARVVVAETDVPALPELPARGPAAGLVGRAAARLVGLDVDLQPAGWRLLGSAGRSGADARRARATWSRDLDALEEALADEPGRTVLVALAGPVTLASALELPRGGPVLADPGATRDVTGALAEGVTELLDGLRRRLPSTSWVLQVDEPGLPAALAGRVLRASGLSAVAPVDPADARARLAAVLDAAGAAGALPAVHVCAARPPVRLLHEAGAALVHLDVTTLTRHDDDELAEVFDHGVSLTLGVVPSVRPSGPAPEVGAVLAPVADLAARLDLDGPALAERCLVAPTCGLAGADVAWSREALALARAAAARLADVVPASAVRAGR